MQVTQSLLPFQQEWLAGQLHGLTQLSGIWCSVPFLLYKGTAVLKWSSAVFQSPRITGSTHDRLSGMGVIKHPSQIIPLDLFTSHWEFIQTPLPALNSTEMAPTLLQMPPCKCTQTFLGCSPGLLLALFQKLMTRYLKTPNIKSVFLIFWN